MTHRNGLIFVGLAVLATLEVEAEPWTTISGNVQLTNGTPLCTMVLANGQYMFSCDGAGSYSLDVPRDANGAITLFAFADGFAPYSLTLDPDSFPFTVFMDTATPGSPEIYVSALGYVCAETNWIQLSGELETSGGAPLCAMFLANGEHMFTCDDALGRFDLLVPLDENGEVTAFAFADGFQPAKSSFAAPECDNVTDGGDLRFATAGEVNFQYEIVSVGDSTTIPHCRLWVTGTNTTSAKKTCNLNITAYDNAGRFLSRTGVQLRLPPAVSDSSYGYLIDDNCDRVGRWELADPVTSLGNPFCVDGGF